MSSPAQPASELPSQLRQIRMLAGMPAIMLGLLVVAFAILRAAWPSDPVSFPLTVTFFERLSGQMPVTADKSLAWYGRRVLDGLVLVLLIGGGASLALVFGRRATLALVALTIIGTIGVVIGGTVGLYAGPILVMGGFALVLVGAGLSWASARNRFDPDENGI